MGDFTKKAMRYYNTQQGSPNADWPTAVGRAREEVNFLYVTHRATALDFRQISPLAKTVPDQAQQRRLPYATILEFIAERYYATESFLRRLKAYLNFSHLKTGDLVSVPNVR